MTNFLSDPFENATVSSVDVVNSEDGAYRFGNENLASFNFDGAVPTVLDDAFEAQYLEPGMYFVVPGTDDTLRSVVEVSLDEDDPLDEMTIVYVGENSLLSTYTCDGSDFLTVQYESWDERVLGTQGWTITAGGNAIFSNVAVRGRIEATEGYISGTVVIGSSEVPADDIASIDDLDGYIPDGQAANDIVTNATTITGGNISTGRINSSGYNGPATGGGSFSTIGSQFNLDDGTIVSPNFRIDNTGNAFFRGDVTANSGIFGTVGQGWSVGSYFLSGPSNGISLAAFGFDNVGPGIVWGTPSDQEAGIFYNYNQNEILFQGSTNNAAKKNIGIVGGFAGTQGTVRISGSQINLNSTTVVSGAFSATTLSGNGAGITSINPANISAGTAGISITGNAATATTATTATSAGTAGLAGGLITTPSIDVSRITSLFTYNNTSTNNINLRVSGAPNGYEFQRNATSSKRYKHDIKDIEDPFLILKLNPITFKYNEDYISDNDNRYLSDIPGFIAEEVYEVDPILADLDEEGLPEDWNVKITVPLIVKLVQEQHKIIEDLQDRVLQLESQLGG